MGRLLYSSPGIIHGTIKYYYEDGGIKSLGNYTEKIKLLQLAKLQTVLFGLIGLCFGIYYSIGGMFIDILVSAEVLSAEKWETPGLSIGTLMAYMALVAMPPFYYCLWFCVGNYRGLALQPLPKTTWKI